MIKIQTMADIQALQKNKDLPSFYLKKKCKNQIIRINTGLTNTIQRLVNPFYH